MDVLHITLILLAAAAVVAALMLGSKASAGRRQVAELEARIKLLEARPDPAPPEPAQPEPAPEPEPEPEPDPPPRPARVKPSRPEPGPLKPTVRMKTGDRDDPLRRHAVEMVNNAFEMSRYLGFDAAPDPKRPKVYRVPVDLTGPRDRQVVERLESFKFDCVEQVKIEARRAILLIDTGKPRPS